MRSSGAYASIVKNDVRHACTSFFRQQVSRCRPPSSAQNSRHRTAARPVTRGIAGDARRCRYVAPQNVPGAAAA